MGKILQRLLPLAEAIDSTAKEFHIQLGREIVTIYDSIGRISADDIVALLDLPFFDRSAVDGYAVRAEDTYGASEFNPIVLKVVGEAKPGIMGLTIGPGEAVKIYTGAPLPKGANAVIMFEDVIENGDIIYVLKGIGRYANVSIHGEDIQRGRVIVKKGIIIEPKHIAVLAAIGISKVEVYEKIRVCLMCIGDEVIEAGAMNIEDVLAKGLTYNSTGPLLLSLMKQLGFIDPVYLGIAKDIRKEIRMILEKAIDKCHIYVTTGGVGPSHQDVTIDAIEEAGGRIIVRGIAIRPGRPTSAGVVNGKPIFMLSGFPVAAFLGFKFFVLPTLEKALGIKIPSKFVIAKLRKRVVNTTGYTTFVRVKLYTCEDNLCAEPLAASGSGTISTILDGDGILTIPEYLEGFDEDQYVRIELL